MPPRDSRRSPFQNFGQWNRSSRRNVLSGDFYPRRFEIAQLPLLVGREIDVAKLLRATGAMVNPAKVDAADGFDALHEPVHAGDVSSQHECGPRIARVPGVIANRRRNVGEAHLHLGRDCHAIKLLLPIARGDQIIDEYEQSNVERLAPADHHLSVNQTVVDAIEVNPHQRPTTISDAFPLSAAVRAASVGETSALKTKSRSVARFTPLTRTSPGVSLTRRRAAMVALPAGRSVKITRAPVRASCSRMVFSISSGVIPIIESTTSLSAIPQIWPTAETRPAANSPRPTPLAPAVTGPPPVCSLMIFLEILLNIACSRCLHAANEP